MKFRKILARILVAGGNRALRWSRRILPPAPPVPVEPPSRFLTFFYPGHFYTPLPDPKFVDENAASLFRTDIEALPGIDDNWKGQMELLEQLLQYSRDYQPASNQSDAKTNNSRFFTDNTFFKEFDAFVYHAFLRHFRPRKIVEVGSGFTSALALDTIEKFIQPPSQFIFIEPYPERLHLLIKSGDQASVTIHEKPVQQIDRAVFESLGSGDFLFIDSSHVSKIGSDVNFLLLDILPNLAKGVIIHVHDVFWPFEYPKAWLDEGRSWTEAYLLRGVLGHSRRYQILFFNSQVALRQPELLRQLPDWAKPGQAGSIWLEVVG